jgi:hypothetical protein
MLSSTLAVNTESQLWVYTSLSQTLLFDIRQVPFWLIQLEILKVVIDVSESLESVVLNFFGDSFIVHKVDVL